MDSIIAWCIDNPAEAAMVAGVALDIIAGIIPDKYLSYVGVVRRAVQKLGKK